MGKIHGSILSAPSLAALFAGAGDAEAVRSLRASQQSKHRLLLIGLLDLAQHVAPDDAERAGLLESFDTLCAVESSDPAAVAASLIHPQFGAWAVHCLRRLKRSGRDTPESPLWIDLAHLGSVTLASAVAAGVDVKAIVPIRDGTIMVPGRGRMMTDARSSWALGIAQHSGDTIILDGGEEPVQVRRPGGVDQPGWQGIRRVRSECDGLTLDLELDDIDPYRDPANVGAAGRLSDEEVRVWRERLHTAWALLVGRHERSARAIAAGLSTLVPLALPSIGGGASATFRHASGSVMIANFGHAEDLAGALVHELQHMKLNALLDNLSICDADASIRYYSPWRMDPRPLNGLLQGTYAFLAVARFWNVERQFGDAALRDLAQFEFALARRQVRIGATGLKEATGLAASGRGLVAAMDAAVTALEMAGQVRPVSPKLETLADDALADHEALWRIRNLQYEQAGIEALIRTWLAGADRPASLPEPVNEFTAGGSNARDHHRLRLVRSYLADRAVVVRLADTGTTDGPAVTPADVRLTMGDARAAATIYESEIIHGRGSAAAWAGLSIAHRRLGTPGVGVLVNRAELVRAVFELIRKIPDVPRPVELAQWLSGSEAETM